MSNGNDKTTGADISNAAYEALQNCPFIQNQTITQKFYFVQGFKAGVEALSQAIGNQQISAMRELKDFVNNGFFFAKPPK